MGGGEMNTELNREPSSSLLQIHIKIPVQR